ncbi:hypothetical protein GCM10009677_47230 [Sphaerisporangium rubeum]|uniref:Uncharacterized protein n=1 Tax=Sphaerisporangium rubeum TaxID=321317 RepID=A0A7X0IGG8_9ACTN|nr:hypothetical protein [Sphaerisporangium rubeum]MBB6474595.1 hypothetical protein [Sphaerisporangium rubeum]
MPSVVHDTLNSLFRNRPELAAELLRDRFGVHVPPDAPVHVTTSDFNDRPSRDSQADTVILVGSSRDPLHGIIVEIQQDVDDSKRRGLARYAAALWLRLDRPVSVLVVCPNPKVAAWAAEPIRTTLPGYVLSAEVLGPALIPKVTDPAQAADNPELAAISVMAHGRHRAVVTAFMTALEKVPLDHAPHYYEYAHRLASPAARRILEEIMSSTTWPVYSPFAREHFGKGLAEGRTEGQAESLLTVIHMRGITVPGEVKERIMSCRDHDQLDTWLQRAVGATSLDEIFGAD